MLASGSGGFRKAAEGTLHMKVIESALGEVLLFEPAVHGDARGFFFESYRENEFRRLPPPTAPSCRTATPGRCVTC